MGTTANEFFTLLESVKKIVFIPHYSFLIIITIFKVFTI